MTGEEKRESGVSRREALQKGTFATAGLLGLSSLGAESARAQSSEPRIRLGDEWVIDPDGDDFSIEHSSLGVSFVWDESAGHWVPGGGGFDMDGGDIVDGGTTVYDASTDTVGDGSTSADHQSLDTEQEHRTADSPILLGSVGRREDFEGADADARLDNALSAASSSDVIYLENATYSADRTGSNSIDTRVDLIGVLARTSGTSIDADWTLTNTAIESVAVKDPHTLELGGSLTTHMSFNIASGATLSITADQVVVSHIYGGGTAEFAAGTADGEMGLIEGTVTTNDNSGSNSIL
jgi:hypothetical protein